MMVKFSDVFIDETKKGFKIHASNYLQIGRYPIIDQGQSDIAGYTNLENGVFNNIPAIIFGDHTRIIKYIDKPFFLGADGVKILKSKIEDVNYKYLYYCLLNAKIPNTGYNRHFKWLKQLEIPLPSLEEQRKIAETLDKVSDLISKRKQQLEKLDLLVKSRFVEMFGDIHSSELYPYKKIKDFTIVISGGTPDRNNSEYWDNGCIPWVKTTELQNSLINESQEKITVEGMKNSSAKLVPPNTILLAMYGQGKTRGMTGYLGFESTTNQACACILPSETINQKYLWKYLIFSYDKLRNLAKGGNQPNLNCNMIKEFEVLFPPMELQNQFAKFVQQTEQTKTIINQSLEKIEILKKALMQEYFG